MTSWNPFTPSTGFVLKSGETTFSHAGHARPVFGFGAATHERAPSRQDRRPASPPAPSVRPERTEDRREPVFVTEISFRRAQTEPVSAGPQASVQEPQEPVHEPAVEPVAEAHAEPLPVAPVPEQAHDGVVAPAQDPVEIEMTEEVVVEHEPEAEPDVESDVPGEAPFYKHELSLRRRSPQPVAEMPAEPVVEADEAAPPAEEVVEAEVVELTPVADAEPIVEAAAESKVPFYKREISFGRKAKPAAPALEAVADPVEPVAEEIPAPVAEQAFEHALDLPAELPVELPAATADGLPAWPVEDEPAAIPAEEPVWAVAAEPVAEPVKIAPAVEAQVEAEVAEPVAEIAVEPVAEVEEPAVSEPDAAPVADEPQEDAPQAVSEEHEPRPTGRRSLRSKPKGTSPAPKRSLGPRGKGRRVVGLKIGASQLAAAVVSQHDGVHELVDLARTPLAPGVVVEGEVRDAETLTTALRDFFAEHNLPTRDVRLGLASSRIGVRTFDVVGVEDESRLDNAVRFKAHEVLPVAVHESVLDYRVLQQRVTESGDPLHHVLLAVAPRDQVEPYIGVCRGAGVRLTGIDLEALGLLRAFVEPSLGFERTQNDTATVVVSIGHESSTLLVAGGSNAEFTRVFDWGGSALHDAVGQELQVTAAESAAILHGLSLLGASARRPIGVDDSSVARALEAVRLRLTPFARELVSSLQFYQAQTASLGIGEILITGGTSALEGLAEALHQMIGVPVRVGDPLERLVVKRRFDDDVEAARGSLAIPIGLAVEDDPGRSVNLLPPELRNVRRKPRVASVALPVAVAVPALAMGFMFLKASDAVGERNGHKQEAQAALAALPVPTVPTIDPALAADQAQRATAVAEVLGGRLAWDRVLPELSRVLPGNVWLTQVDAKVPTPLGQALAVAATPTPAPAGTPVAPTGVTITGLTYTQGDVANLLARIQTLPSMTNVQLQTSTQSPVGKKTLVKFTILADLRESGGAQ